MENDIFRSPLAVNEGGLTVKKIINILFLLSIMTVLLVGCGSSHFGNKDNNEAGNETQLATKERILSTEKSDEDKDNPNGKESTNQIVHVAEKTAPNEKQPASANEKQTASSKQQIVAKNQEAANEKKSIETSKQVNEQAGQALEQMKPAAINSVPNGAASNQKAEQKNEVLLSIKGDEDTGVILIPTKVPIEPGDSVLDILKKVTKQKHIQMEYKGSGGTAYIEGIQNLYEFDKGPKSGWMFSINGVFMNKSAGIAKVKPGDKIVWQYTLDLGKDLGEDVDE